MLSTHPKTSFNFSFKFILLSANAFNFIQSKFMLFGKELSLSTFFISGTCICDENWVGDGCWTPSCLNNCSDRGYCNATTGTPFCSNCEVGWMGEDCSTVCNGVQEPMDSGMLC